ncbi:MAG TPA: hypothetical protein VKA09_17525 [Nitrososphaeraceae archaeon]|nr:hypothetical protein [Nitrososphaeraceae archaeon]
MRTDQFSFLKDIFLRKCKAAIIAATISLGVLLLLPASLGYGGTTTIQEAFGQFNLPSPDGGAEQQPPPPPVGGGGEEEAIPASASTFLLRGFIGSSLPAQGGVGIPTTENGSNTTSYIVNGRWRIFANESLVNRFVAEMDLAAISGAAINGAAFHNITIEDTAPHRFQLLTESGGGNATAASNTTTATGSVPPVSSNLTTRIYVDGNTPIIDNVPMTISIRGQVLAIEGIDIDETRITDTGQQDILSIIDGQSIYGAISR